MRKGRRYPSCFDPYLRYAISTHFKDFAPFDERKHFRLFLLLELKAAGTQGAFKNEMRKKAKVAVEFGPTQDATRYVTLRARRTAVTKAATFAVWDKYVMRVELSIPVKPSRRTIRKRRVHDRRSQGAGKLIMGLLDDGCPFAAAQFLNASGGTRVRAIWDQNQGRQAAEINDSAGNPCVFGQAPVHFQYGLEFLRDSAPSGAPRSIGLDEWIALHRTALNSIDEDGCYKDAGFTRLKSCQSHGAHVMDMLAGRIPPSSRIALTPAGHDHPDPPSWRPAADPASSADVVFVQFPDSGIRDATGVWLKAYVLDGIRYVLSCADPNNTETVFINLSYGPTTGPHDGTAVLEKALVALVREFNGRTKKPKLEIALPAGNSYLTEGHVAFRRHHGRPDNIHWSWRLLPDNTALCFAEVWMKKADAVGVTVSLTSPGGANIAVDTPSNWGNHTVWRLEVGPTVAERTITASEHGDYTIRVAGVRQGASINAYVARTDRNMGVQTGAKRSYFVDPKWEQTRSAEAACIRVDGEFDRTGSLISRFGTLNGIATESHKRVHVAGGYVLADGHKSPYSSAGPARRGPRVGPDFVLPGDASYALGGMRAGGTRSGTVFRLIGTSAAAPQLARQLLISASPPVSDIPSTPTEKEKRGAGDVAPP